LPIFAGQTWCAILGLNQSALAPNSIPAIAPIRSICYRGSRCIGWAVVDTFVDGSDF
jgi:hypothetical protein